MPRRSRPLIEPEEFDRLARDRDPDALLEALRPYIRSSGGPEKVHESAAARQRAYRERIRRHIEEMEQMVKAGTIQNSGSKLSSRKGRRSK